MGKLRLRKARNRRRVVVADASAMPQCKSLPYELSVDNSKSDYGAGSNFKFVESEGFIKGDGIV